MESCEMMRSERVSRSENDSGNAWEQFNLNPNLADDTFSQIDSRGKRRKKSKRFKFASKIHFVSPLVCQSD